MAVPVLRSAEAQAEGRVGRSDVRRAFSRPASVRSRVQKPGREPANHCEALRALPGRLLSSNSCSPNRTSRAVSAFSCRKRSSLKVWRSAASAAACSALVVSNIFRCAFTAATRAACFSFASAISACASAWAAAIASRRCFAAGAARSVRGKSKLEGGRHTQGSPPVRPIVARGYQVAGTAAERIMPRA